MKLKLKTDYALRVLLFLAHRQTALAPDDVPPVPVDDVAGAFGISRDHVVKVVQSLVRSGWVETRAGRGGGLVLAADPATITVAEVVAAFEERSGVLECVERPAVCVLEPGCRLRRLLIGAEEAFYRALAGQTIADLADIKGRKGGLRNLHLTEN
jgi:Rrf2 family nitric oxide-sensitive transcriptional repressor